MASIRSLLDTFGPPPYEICLDWAYQINAATRLAAGAAVASESSSAAIGAPAEEAHWTGLEVAGDGSLRLDALSCAMARQALEELQVWLGGDRPVLVASGVSDSDAAQREMKRSAESFGVCDSLNASSSTCARFPAGAKRKRGAWLSGFSIKDRRIHLTGTGVLIAALGTLSLCLRMGRDVSKPSEVNESASRSVAIDEAPTRDSQPEDAAAEEDLLLMHDGGGLEGNWTTSDELTGGALESPFAEPHSPILSPAQDALHLAPPPSLPRKLSDVAATLRATASEAADASAAAVATNETAPDVAPAETLAAAEVGDVMSQVADAARQAEVPRGDPSMDETSDNPATDNPATDAEADGPSDNARDWTRQPPLVLSRNENIMRPAAPRELLRRVREPHWLARIEVPEGFVCEPASLQTLDPRAGAQWRIYDQKAKSPRACIIVSVHRRSNREPGLEWRVRGGAEDLPDLHLPLARKWLDVITAQLNLTAASLRAAMDPPTQTIPRELRTLLQNRRQLARQQLAVAERLLSLLAEVDHLASVLDDEWVCHAELRASQDGPPLLRYGSCEPEADVAEAKNPAVD